LDLVFNLRIEGHPYKNLNFIPVREYPVVAVLPPTHKLASKKKLQRDDLKGEQFVLVRQGYGGISERQQAIRKFMTDYIDFSHIHYAKDTETIMFMVAAGFGVSFLPEYTLSAVKDYHLKALPIEGVNLKANIIAAWITDNDNPALEILTKEIKHWISGN
jgi:DNA-binding transcriptional LysR family regulator